MVRTLRRGPSVAVGQRLRVLVRSVEPGSGDVSLEAHEEFPSLPPHLAGAPTPISVLGVFITAADSPMSDSSDAVRPGHGRGRQPLLPSWRSMAGTGGCSCST